MRLNASNNAQSVLTQAISETDTLITVEDASTFPSVPFLLTIEEDEIVKVSEVDGNNLTVERAQEGTVAKEWAVGSKIENNFTAGMYDRLVDKTELIYQIPNIVDAQIRINRLSDTNRLFFKLEDDLTGDITISTDGGSTEKPLQDIDGVQITQLEKGFVEVVADANFFILRNRGISQADKQALIDIVNEAERNESDLRQLFIDDINSKGASLTEHSTWFDALNALSNIEIGKKKEIGVRTVSSSSVAFEYADGSGTINSPSISIFDLDFLPSLIFTISVTNRAVTIYSDTDDGFYEKTVKKFSFRGNTLGATSTHNLKGDVLPAFVNFGEFCIPTGSGEIFWIAIE